MCACGPVLSRVVVPFGGLKALRYGKQALRWAVYYYVFETHRETEL